MEGCKVKVCRICFAMDCQLHHLHENMNLYKGYEGLTGLTLADEEDLPPYLCTYCAEQLMNCARFRHRSLQAHLKLLDILKNHDHISVESIKDAIKTTPCGSDIEHTEGRMFGDVKIKIEREDIPIEPHGKKVGDEIKIEFMSDDDTVGDEAVPCVEMNNVVKEEVSDEASVDDNDDSELGTAEDSLQESLPSGQDKVKKGARKRAGTSKDSSQTEVIEHRGAKTKKTGSKPKKRVSTWDEDSLRRAMKAVHNNELTANAAAIQYNIPKQTLRNRLQTGISSKVIKKSALTKQLEEELVQRIKCFEQQGIPLTTKFIREQAFIFCETFRIKHDFDMSTRMAGLEWLDTFLIRHPLTLKRNLKNPTRDQHVIQHFEEVKKVFEELDIISHPERLYNMDERDLRVKIKDDEVLAKEGNGIVTPGQADKVTVTMCVNAEGTAIPPMISFNGVRYRPQVSNLPPGTIVNMADNDSISQLFVKFLQHLAQYKAPGKCLLILNGAKCRLTFEAVEKADKKNIVLYCIPPNTTQQLQPLNKLLRSFEQHWNEEMLRLCISPDKSIDVKAFDGMFSRTWSKYMNEDNIMSGFKASGLCPLDPDVISDDAEDA